MNETVIDHRLPNKFINFQSQLNFERRMQKEFVTLSTFHQEVKQHLHHEIPCLFPAWIYLTKGGGSVHDDSL